MFWTVIFFNALPFHVKDLNVQKYVSFLQFLKRLSEFPTKIHFFYINKNKVKKKFKFHDRLRCQTLLVFLEFIYLD